MAALDRGIQGVLRRDRGVALGSLAAVVGLAWVYLSRSAAGMDHASMAMAAMPRAADAGALALTLVMWTVMMAGMMLPSAAPDDPAVRHAGSQERRAGHGIAGRLDLSPVRTSWSGPVSARPPRCCRPCSSTRRS